MKMHKNTKSALKTWLNIIISINGGKCPVSMHFIYSRFAYTKSLIKIMQWEGFSSISPNASAKFTQHAHASD